jgi:hypothetical protein
MCWYEWISSKMSMEPPLLLSCFSQLLLYVRKLCKSCCDNSGGQSKSIQVDPTQFNKQYYIRYKHLSRQTQPHPKMFHLHECWSFLRSGSSPMMMSPTNSFGLREEKGKKLRFLGQENTEIVFFLSLALVSGGPARSALFLA